MELQPHNCITQLFKNLLKDIVCYQLEFSTSLCAYKADRRSGSAAVSSDAPLMSKATPDGCTRCAH